jgi:sugar phosphate isomerase/epimerase
LDHKLVFANTSLAGATPLEFIDAAARAGFDGIGLRLFRSPGLTYGFTPVVGDAAAMRGVKQALSGSGLFVNEVLSYYMPPVTDVDAMRPSLAYAAELGAAYALVIADDVNWPRLVDSFGRFCDVAAEYSITAAIEAPVFGRVLNSLEKNLKLVVDSGRENAVLAVDPYHHYRCGDRPQALRDVDARLLPWTQLSDGLKDPPGSRLPGTGEAPLAALLDELTPGLTLSIECALRDASVTPAEWAQAAIDETRSFLEGYYAAKG